MRAGDHEAAAQNLLHAEETRKRAKDLSTPHPAACAYLDAQTTALIALTQAVLSVATELKMLRGMQS